MTTKQSKQMIYF